MQTLIIGASGYLGSHIYDRLRRRNEPVAGTYSSHCTRDGLIRFELGKDSPSSIDGSFSDGPKCAVLCAAMTSIDACKKHKEKARFINVDATMRLIDDLHSKGYFIIFFSTADVYDGAKGRYTETDGTGPVNEYGKMKLIIEEYIMKNRIEACILRLAKVVGDIYNDKDVFRDWLLKAKSGENIYCIAGKQDSFVDVKDVINCVEIVRERRLSGIFNIAGNRSYYRIDACKRFFTYLNISKVPDIYEKKLDFFRFADQRALNTGMENGKARKILGYKFKSLDQIFEDYKILIKGDFV